MSKSVPPALGAKSFSCPHCGAFASQTWFKLYLEKYGSKDGPKSFVSDDLRIDFDPETIEDDKDKNIFIDFTERLKKHDVTQLQMRNSRYSDWELHNVFASTCFACGGWGVWVKENIAYPPTNSEIERHADLPDILRYDFEEAAAIVDKSPRGAAALLRLCIQKIMPILNQKGKDLNEDIAALVKNGLPVDVQRALDVVRVTGNNAVHPGQIDLKDDKAAALVLFDLLNMIVERMISTPKKLEAVFKALPSNALEAIEKRDGRSANKNSQEEG